MTTLEPEKLVIRRLLPFAPVAVIAAFTTGAVLGDVNAGWSGALGVAVVTLNAAAAGLSLAWAAGVSPTVMYAVGLGGFVVRLVVFLVLMVGLDGLAWFSPVAFAIAFMAATVAVLSAEMKILSDRRLQADLWYFRERTS
jgi:site-specific recombinase